MKRLLSIFTLLLFWQSARACNPIWIKLDKTLIKAVVELNKNDPTEVEAYFKNSEIQKNDTTKENLGFGWKMWDTGIGAGYISISATFVYYHDSIVNYSLTPEMPEEKLLVGRYRSWYQEGFQFDAEKILPFHYRPDEILKPLKEYQGVFTSQTIPYNLGAYMSPISGTMYGFSGGYSNSILQNRRNFISIQDSLTNDQVILLLYSINPASRFTAIEYYYRHKDEFTDQEVHDAWIEGIFQELPSIKSLDGCFGVTYDSRILVERYASSKHD